MSSLIVAARVVLALVFIVAGCAKLADLAGSRKALHSFGLPERLATPLALLLPLAELGVAVALLLSTTAWWGAIGALALLLLFIAGIAYNLAQGRTPDCHCFGQLHSAPVGWSTLLRNGLLAIMAGYLAWQGPGHSQPSMLSWVGTPTPLVMIGLVGGLVIVVLLAGMTWLLLSLLQQNGRLLLRIEALEDRLGIESNASSATEPSAGLAVGMAAPNFELSSLENQTVTLDALRERGKPVVLVFSDPGCGPCAALLPDVASWQHEHQDALTIALISRGTAASNRAKVDGLGLTNVLLQQDREVSHAYQIKATPTAALIQPDGRIGGPLALGAGAITAMIANAANGLDSNAELLADDESDYPDPLPIGALAPEFTLPDLDGKSVELADFRGRPTLLLFWDPDCGFCQRMLSDLQEWTRHPPKGAPQLLIISTGSVADNRAMGLYAPIVLDKGFRVGQMFGATGTPMAVMIDAQGRIDSPVRAGAPAVFALAQKPYQMNLLPA